VDARGKCVLRPDGQWSRLGTWSWAWTWSWGEGFSTLENLLMDSSPGGKCHVAYTVARAAGEIDYDPIIKSDGCKAEPKER
jgi:hypothetical protein